MVKMLTSYKATMEKYELCFSILHYSVNIIQFCIYTVNLTGHFKEYQVPAQHIGFAPADGKAGVQLEMLMPTSGTDSSAGRTALKPNKTKRKVLQ